MKTVIFRPTNSCNLACTYCYDKNNHELESKVINCVSKKFAKEFNNILESLDKIFRNEKRKQLIFHGGEPLLIKPDLLDKFCNELKNRNIRMGIQTNGTLITDDIIEIFKKYKFSVGISLDGCNEKQNCKRIYSNGSSSFEKVIKNIKKLQDKKVKFGIIMSIGKQHIGCEKEIYDFIGDNNYSCNIRPVFATDESMINEVMTEEEYINFFDNLFDIWFNDKEKKVRTHQVNELYTSLKKEINSEYIDRLCSNSNNCFKNFICLDIDSNLYSCNRLYGIDEFYYGNLKEISMDEVEEKIKRIQNKRNRYIKKECGECKEYKKCYGGCPAEAYDLYKDIKHKAPICNIKKEISKHIKEEIENC